MQKKVIIGLGTGRCGTNTLMRLLRDNGLNATHEDYYMSWENDMKEFCYAANSLKNRTGDVSDTAFYWLNYVEPLLEVFPQARFVCLKRDKEKVVASFDHRTPNHNWWTDVNSKYWDDSKWRYTNRIHMMPKYDLPKLEALGKYYDDYYGKSHVLAEKYGSFRIFQTEDVLNNRDCQLDMFDFIGVDNPKIYTGRKYNERFRSNIEVTKKTYHEKIPCIECGKPATHDIHNKSFSFLVRVCDDCKDDKAREILGHHLSENGEYRRENELKSG